MRNTPFPPTLNDAAIFPVLSIVTIHHGFTAGIRAKEALNWLRYSLGGDFQINANSWSFQDLEMMNLRLISMRVAAVADLIIMAAPDAQPVPGQIKRWLDTCLKKQHGRQSVLVALHEDLPDCTNLISPFCSELEEHADKWQIDFMRNQDFDERVNREFASRYSQPQQPVPMGSRLVLA